MILNDCPTIRLSIVINSTNQIYFIYNEKGTNSFMSFYVIREKNDWNLVNDRKNLKRNKAGML